MFVTNQNLSPKQRSKLTDIARASGKEADIIHLQRLQNLLDSPTGYGIRIQYLRIAMTIEEQLSWASDSYTQTAKALEVNAYELRALRASIDRLSTDQTHIMRTLATGAPLSAITPDLISVSAFVKNDNLAVVSEILDPSLVLLFHRLICFDLPSRAVGQLRTNEVRLGNNEGRIATHIQPPPANEVEQELSALCDQWRSDYASLRSKQQKLAAIAAFHAKFLVVHPFLDGNGRVARAILMQQSLDLFDKADMTLMNKGAVYYAALQAADSQDYSQLVALIEPIIL